MHYKLLSTFLLTTAALAAQASFPSSIVSILDIPSSIVSVLETAVPTNWFDSIHNDPAFRSEEINDIMHGTYPAWYSSLPQSVKDWATSAGIFAGDGVRHPTPLIGTSGPTTSGAWTTPLSSTVTASTSTSTATETTTKAASGGSSSALDSTSTSTGGAPAVTGGVAMGLAGAAGILGLAIAL